MADYIVCDNNAVPTDSLLQSSFCERTANNTIHLKIIKVTGTAVRPIDCFTYEDFVSLLRQAIDLTGGIVALRVIETTNSGGAEEILQAIRCGQKEDLWKTFSNAFYLDANGQVALHIMDVT